MNIKFYDLAQNFILSLIAILLFAVALIKYSDIPDVYFSHSSGKCVSIISVDGNKYSCANLPRKYNKVWVK